MTKGQTAVNMARSINISWGKLIGSYILSEPLIAYYNRPRGLMDKASDFESEDCEFESRRGRSIFLSYLNISETYSHI